jgi:hypothetical protein
MADGESWNGLVSVKYHCRVKSVSTGLCSTSGHQLYLCIFHNNLSVATTGRVTAPEKDTSAIVVAVEI